MIRFENKKNFTWWLDCLLLSLLLGVFFSLYLSARPLFVPDEGRYAEIAREMYINHDYITPYLNGIKYFEKPALFYWLGVLALKIGGVKIGALRSINAIFAVIGCLFTYILARKLYDRRTAWFASFILATSTLYFVMGHMITLDMTLTLFLTISLFAYLMGVIENNLHVKKIYFVVAASSAALAVLTKGLVGLVFPLLIISSWIILFKKWHSINWSTFFLCMLFFLCLTLPWHILVQYHNPEFFSFYVIEQHFLRYLTKYVGHYQPFWFFLPYLFLGFFPWIVFFPFALKNIQSKNNRFQYEIFLVLWICIIFAFFSFSKSKLIPYILPIFPPMAILVGNYLNQQIKPSRNIAVIYAILATISLLILIAVCMLYKKILFAYSIQQFLYLFLAVLLLVVSYIFVFLIKILPQYKFISSILSMMIFLLILIAIAPSFDQRTILPLASTVKLISEPQDEVIAFNQYYQDLPFYLERRVSILNWRNELSFGMKHQKKHDWMLKDNDFLWRLQNKKRIFIIIGREEYNALQKKYATYPFYKLNETKNNILLSNLNI